MNYQITRATVATCSFHKFKILTSKQCRCAIGLIFFLATNGWAFETNVDSKVTANFAVTGALDVTGALKAGSVDPSSNDIVISIADTYNDTTIPTTSAVKTYVDAYMDAQVAASSGGYPEEVSTFGADSGNFASAISYCKNMSGDWRLPSVSELINLSSDPHLFWTTDIDSGKYVVVNPVNGNFSLETPTSGWAYFLCVR
jgi:hypothetical protein